ncbi:MAG: polysaccharide deacetylase family protein [Gammaproteobacteria bacterium]|nr:MAG: polysaccharide deacetylase family protein [Gammaproteobacteria bacterium]
MQLSMPDAFFGPAETTWLTRKSLGVIADRQSREAEDPRLDLPAIFRDEQVDARSSGGQEPRRFPFDVFGTAFFLLSRYEEVVSDERDGLGRFPARASALGRLGLLRTPVVDAQIDALAHAIASLWPQYRPPRSDYRVTLTHDVDALRNRGRSVGRLALAIGADLFRRRSPAIAYSRFRAASAAPRATLDERDPFNTFDYLLTAAERHGVGAEFFFVPKPSDVRFDPDYSIDDPDVVHLLHTIQRRGHRIGLHASFHAADSSTRLRMEFDLLRQTAERAGFEQQAWGGRHHYLRWRPGSSWEHWAEAGLHYDSSLGFAEEPGFRCGTSHPYPPWSFALRAPLPLIERPLIVMDTTLFGYQRMSSHAALQTVKDLAKACRRYGGCLVLLWHNHNLLTTQARRDYANILDVAFTA